MMLAAFNNFSAIHLNSVMLLTNSSGVSSPVLCSCVWTMYLTVYIEMFFGLHSRE